MWNRLALAFLILLSAVPPFLHAQTEEPAIGNHSGVDARAVSMGGAFSAIADNGAALHWNPAGLVQTRASQFYLGLTSIDHSAGATLPSSGEVHESNRTDVRLNQLGATFPLSTGKSRLALALGIHRTLNLDKQLDVVGSLAADAPVLAELSVDERTRESGGMYIWRAGLAGLVSPRIAVGGSLDIWTGDHEEALLSQITDPDSVDDISFQELEDTVDRSYLGLGLSIGALAKLHQYVSVGTRLQFPMSLEVDEYWTQSTFQVNDDGTELENFDDGTWLYDLRLPFSVSAGLSIGGPGARISGDIEYTNWTSAQYSIPPEVDVSNQDFQDFYRGVLQWRVGAEYLIDALHTKLRAGYWRHPLAFTANAIQNERDFWTCGFGTLLDGAIEVDVAYARGEWEQESDILIQTVVSHQVYVSAGYRFH